MAKKKYRIYKAGGTKQGKVINPTAQFLAKAQMGMQQSSPEAMQMMEQQAMQQQGQPQAQGYQEELMIIIDQIKQAILQTAPVQEVLEFIVANQLAPDLISANEVYKQVKDELVNTGQLGQEESQDVVAAEEESSQDMPEAEEGMEARNTDSATNDIPVGGRSEQLNKFISTVQSQSNKAKAKDMAAAEELEGVNPLIARNGLTLNDRRTNRRIARFADQMSPMYNYSDRRQIRKGLNSGEMNMADVFSKANMPALEKDDNELVETIDPKTGSRIFVRNRKGIFGKLKQDIYAENVPLSQLSMMYGPSSYASGVYGNTSSINRTGSGYSSAAERRSQIYYTKPTIIEAAEDVNYENIPETAEVNSSTKSSSTKGSTTKGSGTNVSRTKSSGKTAGKTAVIPPATKALNSKIKNVEESAFLNTLTDALIRQKQSDYNRGAIHSGNTNRLMFGQSPLWLNDMVPDMLYREGEEYISGPGGLDKPIQDYVLGDNAMSVDEVISLVGDDVNLLREYQQLFPTSSPEHIEIENYIINSDINQGKQSAAERQQAILAAKPFDPNNNVYQQNESGASNVLNTIGAIFTNPVIRGEFLRMYSPFHQEGGYIDSTNPDLYKFTGGGDYFADGGTQDKDVTDPYLVQAEDGMMSEQPNPGETMKDYFIRTGRQDQLQYISPEQQAQVYNVGTADVADIDDPYKNTKNTYGAWTNAGDINAANKSIEEQADVTRSITATGQKDRDIDTTQQRARDKGYFGDDSMNFMSRYEAWKRGGKSQNIEDGYRSDDESADSTNTTSTGAYGSYGGKRKGLFNRFVNRRDDLSYMEIKGLKKDADGNPIPIDMSRVTDFKSKASYNPLTGKSKYKNRIKFGDPQASNNSKDTEGDDKPGFFDRVKDKAGSMIEGFGNRNKGKDKPASISTNQQLGPSDEPTYQQQIEGDGREYDDLIMRDFDAASKANQNSTPTTSNREFSKEMYPDNRQFQRMTRKKLNSGKFTRDDIREDIEADRIRNERNALMNTPGNNSGQAPFRTTMMDAPNEDVQMLLDQQNMTSPNSTIEYFGDPRSQTGSFSYGTGGAYNTFQFGTSGVNNAMLDAANILQGQQQGIENLDRIANNPNDEMATNSRYIDGERVMEEEAEGEEELYQDGTIRMKKKDPYDVDLAEISSFGFKGMDLFANTAQGMRNANTKGDITTNAMFADETEYEQPAKRGMRSLNTRLDLGDSGAKYAMIKGQNRAEFGGFMRNGGLTEGEIYDLSMDEIKEIIANGGQIEFI